MTQQDLTEAWLADACATTIPGEDHAALLARVNAEAGNTPFHHVLTRTGWHRLGGVVKSDGTRVAPGLRQWAEQECDNDMFALYERYADAGLATTRFEGKMHYFAAPFGGQACDYVQLEVEELVEVIDRPLFVNDEIPDDIEDLCDPAGALEARLDPTVLKPARYALHQVTDVAALLNNARTEDSGRRYIRVLQEWDESTAGIEHRFCDHFALRLLPFLDRFGEHKIEATPLPVQNVALPDAEACALRGAAMANYLHDYNRQAGFPLAWYFMMLVKKNTLVNVAQSVHLDHQGSFDYLAERDLAILERWMRNPYSF